MATIIVMRRPNDRMALFSAIFLVTFGGMTFPGTPATLAQFYPVWGIPTALLGILGNATSVTFLYLFPTGRFVPRRAPILIALWTAIQAPGALFPHSAFSFDVLPGSVVAVVFLIGLGFPLGAQIYRFRKFSNVEERQQTKPVVFGLALALGGFLTLLVAGIFAGPSTLTLGIVSDLIIQSAFYVFMLCVPVSIAVAVLRYRLWDVDALVNRTLVYVSLTASLVALYFGCVVGLQALFRAFTGQASNLTIAISTLSIAAAFQPLRRRIQAGIDHRFYRRKYDAAKTLAAFTARLRDEVDLEHLSHEMTSVVRETMQPAHVSLWLRHTDEPHG